MPIRTGRYTLLLPSRPAILGSGAVVGKQEGEGPLKNEFDRIFEDATIGEESWEKAESAIQKEAILYALNKAGKTPKDIDAIFAGDLLNQVIGTTFGIRELNIPFVGIYGACSTMALSMVLSAIAVDTGSVNLCVSSTSSHFCSAEKQFRYPLEYGGQKTPTSQRTVTGAGAAVFGKGEGIAHVEAVTIGRIHDLGIKDPNNMGAAMAPAAHATITDFLNDTNTKPEDYDLILTGDLGAVGTELLYELMQTQSNLDISQVHGDCGMMIYDLENQNVCSGGSGCGCSGSVVCSYIMRRISAGELNKVLFVATGALMSTVSQLQGESIPSIAHAVLLTGN